MTNKLLKLLIVVSFFTNIPAQAVELLDSLIDTVGLLS